MFSEARGRSAGYGWPQLSLHRGDLHEVLVEAVTSGSDAMHITLDHQCIGVEQDEAGVRSISSDSNRQAQPSVRGSAVIGCDGFHSAMRRQLYPDEGAPYQGINMWRSVSRWKPFLSGASAAQAGWLEIGKILMFPFTPTRCEDGLQEINWVAEIQSERNVMLDWNLQGQLADILPTFGDWHFPWLDVGAMIRAHHHCSNVRWWIAIRCRDGPSDGSPWSAMPHIRCIRAAETARARASSTSGRWRAVSRPSRMGRAVQSLRGGTVAGRERRRVEGPHAPPDLMLKRVHERSGERPFDKIDDLISQEERAKIVEDYKRVAGYGRAVRPER